MTGSAARFPEAVFLKRSDDSGYAFFYSSEDDFKRAVDSFAAPILRSFAGEPVPGQPEPGVHLKSAIATLVGQAFDRAVSPELGPEGVSRAVAALVRQTFAGAVPRLLMLERQGGRPALRPAIEFLRHPGFPLAVVLDGAPHGGDAHFFSSAEAFAKAGESSPNQQCWLPQIVYRLYRQTPSVMLGHPQRSGDGNHTSVAFRGLGFGLPAPLLERDEG